MGLSILTRGYTSTNHGDLCCPKCYGRVLKKVGQSGVYDLYLCLNKQGAFRQSTKEFLRCNTRFRWCVPDMPLDLTREQVRENPGIVLGTAKRFLTMPKWRKTSLLSGESTNLQQKENP